MPTIAQLRDLTHKHGLRVEYVFTSSDTDYMDLSFRDDDCNYHSAKITFEDGIFYAFCINTNDIDAIMRFVSFFADFKALDGN